MTKRVALVGAGGIGARHVQGLMRLGGRIATDVVDPAETARLRAGELAAEINGTVAAGISYHVDLSTLLVPDLAIVATNARERGGVVTKLVQAGARQFILEKVLFTRLAEYDHIDALFARYDVTAWVNCVRRAYPPAGSLAERIAGRPFDYRVEGQGWGLGCNVVHHLDEFAMLNGEADITLDGAGLLPGTISAKRPGYIEFLGTLTGTAANGSTFSATCEPGDPGDRVVTIACDGTEMRVSQVNQTLSITDAHGTRNEPFPIPFQSQATAVHVDTILNGRAPALTDYAGAAKLHRQMLAVFLDHMRRGGKSGVEECPIT